MNSRCPTNRKMTPMSIGNTALRTGLLTSTTRKRVTCKNHSLARRACMPRDLAFINNEFPSGDRASAEVGPHQMIRSVLLLASLLVTSSIMAEHPSFKLDVMPVFMRHGCNAGDCHGAASGKDGFMLSLFGYDPEGDYYRLLEEHPARRVNVAMPNQSLLLQKATGGVPHTGGKLFSQQDAAYKIINDWISEGAKPDPVATPSVTGIRMEPKLIEFDSPEGDRVAKVIATYSDGSQRDVTQWCRFLSSNDGVVGIDDSGLVSANRAGGAHVFARFSRFTEGAEVIILPDGEFDWPAPVANNYIDELVHTKLEKLRIVPSDLATDEQFLRRVSIDLVGMLPTADEHAEFLNSNDPDKRKKKIDELIDREDFAELWAAKWGEWLRIRGDTNPSQGTAMKAAWSYFYWLRDQFVRDRPLDELFEDLLTGTGSNVRNPPSNFYTMLPQAGQIDPGVMGKDVAQVTLGIRTGCAECHNHPFDRWTMDDYYGWTSFFTCVKRKKGRESREVLISADVNAKPAEHLIDGRPMPHRFLGGDTPDLDDQDPRQVLATWLTAKDNRLFRRNMANRIWHHFFGRGIVEPIDDIRISNPPSNEPLLEELGSRLAEDHDYQLRDLARDICNSRTYQVSATTNETNHSDSEFFSHAVLRRPRADVLFDCIHQVLENTPRIRRSSKTKAVDLFEGGHKDDYNAYFYSTFGQAPRASVCVCETSHEAKLSQALHLINGGTIHLALTRSAKLIPRLMEEHENDPESVIDALYIAALSRKPSETELDVILGEKPKTAGAPEMKSFYDSVMWGLLNSSEFLFNH